MERTPLNDFSLTPPDRGDNLLEMLRRSAASSPRAGVRLFRGGEEVEWLTLEGLYEDAGRLASGLRNRARVEPGERVALIFSTSGECIRAMFGILAAGAVPVPMPPPLPFSNPERYLQRLRGAVERSGIRLVLGPSELGSFLETLEGGLGEGGRALAISPLFEREPTWHAAAPDEPALIQYTSGSTTTPKGVVLTHRNLLSNVEAIRRGLRITQEDVGCAWLPLFHDMGLIGCLLTSLYAGIPMVLMPPEDFVMDPAGWLALFGRYRGSIAPAPNAGYLYCLKRVGADVVKSLDLSSWRAAMLGAEPVAPHTVRRFIEHFRPAGFRPEAMMPVYGLAESSLAVCFSPVEGGMRTLWVRRSALGRGEVEPVEPEHPEGRELVSVGVPVHDAEVCLMDEEGQATPPGRVGEIHIRGGSVMQGYDRNEESTRAAFRSGWLTTGDLGFIHQGELYVVGRRKEVIIANGQNFYAHDIEHLVNQVPGVGAGGVMALGIQVDGTEGLAVLVETREEEDKRQRQLCANVRDAISSSLGLSPKEVVLLERGRLPRTSSGKLERHKGHALYEKLRAPR
jgi:acyl-CoA synthetase (AMP-forming)/AMP-acid ligase II